MIGFVIWLFFRQQLFSKKGGQMTKPVIVVKITFNFA